MKSPLTGLRSAALEAKNLRSNGWKLFSVVAISLIPLIYAGLFLLAFLDPYGSLNNVPAVVVNKDAGALIDDEERNIGQELCDSLVENNANAKEGEASGYNWTFVSSQDEADQGLRDGKYYMELIIPENFSESIASASDDYPKQAELQVYFNPSTNLIAQTVGASMVTSIKAQLNEKISKNYLDTIFLNITEAGDGMTTAANGAADLRTGLAEAQDGSATLTDGLYTAAEGGDSLTSGAQQLADGAVQLADGLKQMKDGLDGSSDSTAVLSAAMLQVANNLQLFGAEAAKDDPDTALEEQYLQAAAEAAQAVSAANATMGDPLVAYLAGGSFSYTSGGSTTTVTETGVIASLQAYVAAQNALEKFESDELEPLLTDLYAIRDVIDSMSDQGEVLWDDLDAYNDAVDAYVDSRVAYRAAQAEYVAARVAYEAGEISAAELQEYADAVDEAESESTAAEAAVKTARTTVMYDLYHTDASGNPAGLIPDLEKLGTTTVDLLDRIQSVEHVEDLVTELLNLISAQANAGANLSRAAGKVEGYLVGVAVTSSYASSATATLTDGVNQLYEAVATGSDDSTSLVDGTSQLAEGAQTLTDGIYTAADGSQTLTDGLSTAVDGTQTLADGLYDGVDTMEDSTRNSDLKADMMSQPVTANGSSSKGENITQVANYGTGFAPYFIGLGMWVGCLMITFLLRSLNSRILMSNASSFAAVLSSYLPMVAIAVLQVLMLLAIIQFALGLNVNFVPQFYLFGLLTAFCFMAIIQFFRAAFGTSGMVIIVILLMLQLCTSAGTFPIQAEIQIFNMLNPFLPMTYVVQGFRVAMCGLSPAYMVTPAIVLACFMVAFLALTTLVAWSRRRTSISTMYPHIKIAD